MHISQIFRNLYIRETTNNRVLCGLQPSQRPTRIFGQIVPLTHGRSTLDLATDSSSVLASFTESISVFSEELKDDRDLVREKYDAIFRIHSYCFDAKIMDIVMV